MSTAVDMFAVASATQYESNLSEALSRHSDKSLLSNVMSGIGAEARFVELSLRFGVGDGSSG